MTAAALADRVCAGGLAGREELLALAATAGTPAEILELAAAAARVRERFRDSRPEVCTLINAKSGACPEDCRYCAQSARYRTAAPVYGMLTAGEMVERAKRQEQTGADHVCLVASGKGPSPLEFDAICAAAGRIRDETRMQVCGCLGIIDGSQAARLAESGVTRYNHNLESSRRHYPSVCTTHTWEQRQATARAVKSAGMELCCGGILGLGESAEDRVDLALQIRELKPAVVPVNILNARPGTPLDGTPEVAALEAVAWIALYRLALPRPAIKLAGGRETALRDLQGLALLAGADGIIAGGYLTTGGRPLEDDRALLVDCGYRV